MTSARFQWLPHLYRDHPYLLTLLASLAYYLTFFNYGLDLDDEGFLLIGAESILHGKWPIADFFSYQPLSYFVLAGFFKLFGNGVLSERIMLLAILLLNIGLLLYIARKLLPMPWAMVPLLLYALAPGPWYKVFFITHLIATMAILTWYLERPCLRRSFLVGLVIGIAFISRYEAGIISMLMAAGTVFILVLVPQLATSENRLRLFIARIADGIAVVAGSLLVVGLTWYAYVGAGKEDSLLQALNDYYWQSNAGEVTERLGIVSKFNPFTLLTHPNIEQWFYAAAVFATLFMLVRDSIRFLDLKLADQASVQRLLLVAAALGSLAYSYLFVWNSRMLSTFPLVYILWGILLLDMHEWLVGKGKQRLARWLPTILVSIGILSILWFCRIQNYSGSITTRLSTLYSIDHPKLAGIKVYYTQVDDINNLMDKLSDEPDATLIPMSESTSLGYLSGKPNPTYYRLFTTELGGIGEPERLLNAIERHCITHFVARKSQFIEGGGLGSKLKTYAPRVRQHLIDNYRVEPLGKGFVLLTRNTSCLTAGQLMLRKTKP